MRIAGLITAIVLLLAAISMPLYAASFTYSFDRSLGIIRYDEYPRSYSFDFGHQFSNINSVTMHIAGYIHSGSATVGGNVSQALTAYRGTNDVRGIGLGSGSIIDGWFDWTYTFTDQVPYYTEWRQYLCGNRLDAALHFYASDYSRNPDGYANITISTVTIDGTPVPEPSSIIAIICGIGGMGGVIWKRRSA